MAQPEAPGYYSGYGTPPPPEQPKRSVGLIVGAIIAVAVLIMIAGGVIAAVYVSNRGSSDDPAVASSSDPAAADPASSSDPGADSTAPTSGRGVIGKPVRQGDLLITVTSAPRCGTKTVGSGYGAYESEKGHFCLIDLKFENTGAKAVKPKDFGTKLIDENGGEALVEWQSYKANPDDKLPLFENIYPKKSATGVIVFDIPTDQKPATLKMNPVGDYDDEVEISLK
ncbi:DUF4352 domain-containing protein [Cryptosporangium minutisporangium]|uniref:DUF4352 domain-containing protein n=1 Tax=Cryptosporangium minutisporangium TaxID=113569 RepID=A0ABP6T9W8_9ACTN